MCAGESQCLGGGLCQKGKYVFQKENGKGNAGIPPRETHNG